MRYPALAILAAALALGIALPAHAVGRLVDLQIVDRATGETLTPILHDGEWWIAGRPGARYGVVLRGTDQRTVSVLSVDGVNAITGETAGWNQSGYVVHPRRRYEVDGWRKSNSQIAAFEFTALPDSYAARTGRPANVGVIGIATFTERPRPPIVDLRQFSPSRAERPSGEATRAPEPQPSVPPPPSASAAMPFRDTVDAASKARADDEAAKPSSLARSERLGTGHGAIEDSTIVDVVFLRAQSTPNEVVTIHYDRLENLVAMGIVPSQPMPPIAANPFPRNGRFVADPPPR